MTERVDAHCLALTAKQTSPSKRAKNNAQLDRHPVIHRSIPTYPRYSDGQTVLIFFIFHMEFAGTVYSLGEINPWQFQIYTLDYVCR